jgi:cytochrome P450
MSRNADLFPDPSEFRPERFMGPNKREDTGSDPLQFVFGFGRRYIVTSFRGLTIARFKQTCSHRICPGQHLAESSLFLIIAMTLATFRISKACDERGRLVEPTVEWLPGTLR